MNYKSAITASLEALTKWPEIFNYRHPYTGLKTELITEFTVLTAGCKLQH
jgi:hypothetical protein